MTELFGHIHGMHAKHLLFLAQLIIGALPINLIGLIKVTVLEATIPRKASPHAHNNWVACNIQSQALAQHQQLTQTILVGLKQSDPHHARATTGKAAECK